MVEGLVLPAVSCSESNGLYFLTSSLTQTRRSDATSPDYDATGSAQITGGLSTMHSGLVYVYFSSPAAKGAMKRYDPHSNPHVTRVGVDLYVRSAPLWS